MELFFGSLGFSGSAGAGFVIGAGFPGGVGFSVSAGAGVSVFSGTGFSISLEVTSVSLEVTSVSLEVTSVFLEMTSVFMEVTSGFISTGFSTSLGVSSVSTLAFLDVFVVPLVASVSLAALSDISTKSISKSFDFPPAYNDLQFSNNM